MSEMKLKGIAIDILEDEHEVSLTFETYTKDQAEKLVADLANMIRNGRVDLKLSNVVMAEDGGDAA